MNRRSTLRAAVGACAALLFPWKKSHASPAGNIIQDMIQKRAKLEVSRLKEPFNIILCLGRKQLWHIKKTMGQKPIAMRLGKRERQVIIEGSNEANRCLGEKFNKPITHFAGIPIQWTDNECEMTVVTEEQ